MEVNMKVSYWLFIVLILVAFAFAGCGSSDDENDLLGDNGGNGGTSGFASMKAGSWEELTSPDGSRSRSEYIGIDKYNGVECYVMEFDDIKNGKKSSTQVWIDKSMSKGVLYVMKDEDGTVTKMEISQTNDIPTNPGTIPAGYKEIGKKKYTTPTGKTVDAIAYQITTQFATVEWWSSSQVPFGDVKTISNGTVTDELYDFGTSGATRDISKQEAENAKPFDFSGGGDDNGGDNGGGDNGGGGGGQIGNIIITVGAGATPTIKVSQPISSLMVVGPGFFWGFNVLDDNTLPGPFKYGVIPDGAEIGGMDNPPDLVAGSQYTIQVTGQIGEDAVPVGVLNFTR
jgi:hypothetical protein